MPTDPRTIDSYNKNASFYSAHVNNPEDSIYHTYYETPAMHAEYPNFNGLDVISIACGTDENGQWFLNQGVKRLVGVDISEKLIDIARKNNPTVEYHVMDMEKLDFADNSFDFSYSSLAIEYLDNWEKSLREVKRILKPGCRFVFSHNHPIETASEYFRTPTSHGALLGRETDDENNQLIVHGDYFAAGTGGVREVKSILPDSFIYHRPMSKMIEDIVNSGFKIVKLVEPLPTDEMRVNHPREYQKLMKIPVFMIWVLEK
jgi:SAM-dependent methyltransferase